MPKILRASLSAIALAFAAPFVFAQKAPKIALPTFNVVDGSGKAFGRLGPIVPYAGPHTVAVYMYIGDLLVAAPVQVGQVSGPVDVDPFNLQFARGGIQIYFEGQSCVGTAYIGIERFDAAGVTPSVTIIGAIGPQGSRPLLYAATGSAELRTVSSYMQLGICYPQAPDTQYLFPLTGPFDLEALFPPPLKIR